MKRIKRMMLLFMGAIVGILLWPLWTGAAQEAANLVINYVAVQEQEEFVTLDIYFTMTDGNGRPLPNPNIDEATIQLLDGSSERVPAIVEDPATPIYITLIIDASGSMRNVIDDVKAAAQTAIDRAPPNAFFSVMQFNETWQVLEDYSNDPARIKAAIARVTVEDRGTCLYDATYEGIDQLARQIQSPQERRAIILFTDGQDQLTRDNPEPCSVYTYQDVINHARPAVGAPGTPIHTIGLSDGSLNNINAPELRSMAAETTAFSAIGGTDRLDSLFEEIMAGLNSQLVARASLFAAEGNNRGVLSISSRDQGVPLDSTFDFFSSRTYNAPPPPAKTNIGSVQYDAAQDLYRVTLSIANPESVAQIVVQAWDSRGGVQVSRDYIFPNPAATLIVEIETAGFEAGREYSFRVQGTDQSGFLIEDDDGNTLLAEAQVQYAPQQVEAVEFTIQSVNALYESGLLVIDLDVPDPGRIQTYEGFIVDEETGQRIHDFGPTPFSGPRIQEQLPAPIATAETAGKYRITVYLNTAEALRSEAVYDEFSPVPPEPPGLFARIAGGLGNNPVIFGSVLIIIFALIGFFMFRSRSSGKSATPIPRPPVDRTQVYDPEAIAASSGYGSADPWAGDHEENILGAPYGETPIIQPRLRLRILQSPSPQLENDKVIQKFPYLIGREESDLNILGDRRISRRHLRITEEGGTIYITDLQSSNGTYVGGQKLAPDTPTAIYGSEQVYLGSQTLLELSIE